MKKIILGVDPGFASFGYAALALDLDAMGDGKALVAFGVLETEKSPKKASVLATEDNLRRARELATGLELLLEQLGANGTVVAIAAEAQSWPRNAGATAKVGIAWGILAAIAHRHRLPIVQASPQAVKKAIAGAKNASKEEVQRAVIARLPEAEDRFAAIGKTRLEHPADALAVALHAVGSDVVLAARRAA